MDIPSGRPRTNGTENFIRVAPSMREMSIHDRVHALERKIERMEMSRQVPTGEIVRNRQMSERTRPSRREYTREEQRVNRERELERIKSLKKPLDEPIQVSTGERLKSQTNKEGRRIEELGGVKYDMNDADQIAAYYARKADDRKVQSQSDTGQVSTGSRLIPERSRQIDSNRQRELQIREREWMRSVPLGERMARMKASKYDEMQEGEELNDECYC